MTLFFKVNKLSNFFFFIDNLAEIDPYARKNYNKIWKKKFGVLTSKEKQIINLYGIIINNHSDKNFRKKIRTIFFQDIKEQLIWKRLKKEIGYEDYALIKNIFKIMTPRFKKIWSVYKSDLLYNKNILSKNYIVIKYKFNKVINKLSKVYGVKKPYNNIQIFLIINPILNSQSGKKINNFSIQIELPKINKSDNRKLNNIWLLILHELCHIYFEDNKYKNYLSKFISISHIPLSSKLSQNKKYLLSEIIISLFLWNNYVFKIIKKGKIEYNKDDHFCHIKNKVIYNNKISQKEIFSLNIIKHYLVYKLEYLAIEFIKNGKKINYLLLDKIFKILQYYPSNLLKEIKKTDYYHYASSPL